MAHTNSTTNYNLPQFVSTDKPAWLTDVNTAYSDIDTGMHAAQVAADNAQGDATQALTTAGEAATTASAADAKGTGAIASLATAFDTTATYNVGDVVIYNNLLYVCSVDVVNPGPWSGSSNWNRTTVDTIATDIKTDISNLKIEDLSNVTLTSSDNNKLMNVTVSDGNISVNAIKPNDFILTDTVSGTIASVNANNYADPDLVVTKAGYRALGLASLYLNNTSLSLSAYYLHNDNANMKLVVRNDTNNQQTNVSYTAVILYVKV